MSMKGIEAISVWMVNAAGVYKCWYRHIARSALTSWWLYKVMPP